MEPETRRESAPVIDEAAFEQLLSAAYVMQEHNRRLRKASKPADTANPPIASSAGVAMLPVEPVSSPTAMAPGWVEKACHECGSRLSVDQFFCETCGAPAERTQKATSKNWASLWDMHSTEPAAAEEEKPSLADSPAMESESASNEEIDLFPAELKEIVGSFPEAEVDPKPEAVADAQAIALVPSSASAAGPGQSASEHSSAWTSAAKARAWFDSLKAQQPSQDWFKEEWTLHRGAIYIAIAAAVLLAVIFQSSTRTAADSGQPRQLTGFERVLVSLGLAEAPPETSLAVPGNPTTKVWVDIHTALYYCPGADLYGKTANGRYATQLEAQRDNFQPSTMKACD